MPRNEEGEFELVLGNRQLLSVFFIVVVLLGVFFVMGYILGKNATPSNTTEIAAARKPSESGPAPNPIVVEAPNKSSAAGETAAPPAEKPKPVEPPKKEEPKKVEVAKKEELKKEAPKPAAAKTEAPKPPPVEVKTGSQSGSTKTGLPPAGTSFLQVAAVGKAEAEIVAKVLRGKGLPTWVAPADKENQYRVLVGPIPKAEQGKVRSQLVEAGFSPFSRSY